MILQRKCVQQHVHMFACLYIRSSVRLNATYVHGSNTWLHCIHCTCSCRAQPEQHHSYLWMAKRGKVTRGDRVRKSKGMGNKQFRKELKNASDAVAINEVNQTEACSLAVSDVMSVLFNSTCSSLLRIMSLNVSTGHVSVWNCLSLYAHT